MILAAKKKYQSIFNQRIHAASLFYSIVDDNIQFTHIHIFCKNFLINLSTTSILIRWQAFGALLSSINKVFFVLLQAVSFNLIQIIS